MIETCTDLEEFLFEYVYDYVYDEQRSEERISDLVFGVGEVIRRRAIKHLDPENRFQEGHPIENSIWDAIQILQRPEDWENMNSWWTPLHLCPKYI